MLIVICGPSGVGKGTVIKYILNKNTDFKLSVSYTTRKQRNGEINGKDYYFVSDEEFARIDFLEWATVHGNKYGTPNLVYEENTLFEVDVQGAKAIKAKRPESIVFFLQTPTTNELAERLAKRNTEKKEDIALRLATAKQELKERWFADFILVNDKVEATGDKIIELIKIKM